MGRGKLPISEAIAIALEELGRQVVQAVARGEFQRARELTEEAILLRASEVPLPDDDALAPGRWPSEE
jgi:hypothetical protein